MAKENKDLAEKKKKPVRKIKRKGGVAPSTQIHLPFSEIRDGMVLMKDGALRRVILVSSINFALKSEDEQKGIIQGYVAFLNSLDFEIQIVIQSRKLDIEKYLTKLDTLARQQDNELLRKQTKAYRSFVQKMVEDADIMDKKFYVIVPYSPFYKKKKSFMTRFQEVLTPARVVKLSQAKLEKYKTELDRRVDRVMGGLRSTGLAAQPLDTQSLIELYYNAYNPVTKQKTRIEDIDKMQVDRSLQT
ncbi:MAG: hypothetical protein ABIG66_02610 [Candidatus Kerfeldbacteria bacterium]